jgi:hypothetical protein
MKALLLILKIIIGLFASVVIIMGISFELVIASLISVLSILILIDYLYFEVAKNSNHKIQITLSVICLIVSLTFMGVSMPDKQKEKEQAKYDALPQSVKDSIANEDLQAKKELEIQAEINNRQELIKKQFSSWDGSHRGVEKYIKNQMNNPKSYEHVETSFTDYGNYLLVFTKFRGENAFGGTVTNTIKAKVDTDGNVIEIIQ